MNKKIRDELFVTGCDHKTEWQLPWFLKNFKKQRNKTKIIITDFGMSQDMVNKVVKHPCVEAIMTMDTKGKERGWFKKPLSMYHVPAKRAVWLDTDCQVLANIDNMFSMLKPNMLNMVEDKPWTKRRGEVWYNSGVVGFVDKPTVLAQWCNVVHSQQNIGDQEMLHSMLNPITQLANINPLPNEYNVMRLQVEQDNYKGRIKIMHWTGEKGNDTIRSMM